MKEGSFTIYIIPHQNGKPIRFTISKLILKTVLLGLTSFWIIFFLITLTFLPLYLSEKKLREESYLKLHILQSQNKELSNLLLDVKDESEIIKKYLKYLSQIEDEIRSSLKLGPKEVSIEELLSRRSSDLWSVSRNYEIDLVSIPESLSEISQDIKDTVNTLNTIKEATETYDELKQKTPDIYPVSGTIVSYFGWRKHPLWKGRDFHRGIDLKASYGAPIKVTADGVVTDISYKGSLGLTIVVYHRDGISTLYAHLSRAKVKKNQEVKKEDVIGFVGTSGFSTGPHLHYEVQYKGVSVDPLTYLP